MTPPQHAEPSDIRSEHIYRSLTMPAWAYYVERVMSKGGEIIIQYQVQGGAQNGISCETTIEEFAARVKKP